MSIRTFLHTLSTLAAGAALWLGQPAHAVIIADSVADFPAADIVTGASKQNINSWQYGYHQDSVAGAGFSYNAGSFIAFPDNDGPGVNASDFWNGSSWDWANAGGLVNPPWTFINSTSGHPNNQSVANGGEQWAVRRYISEAAGSANVEFHQHKDNLGGGDGTTVRLFHNGVAVGENSFAVAFNNAAGRTWSVHVPNLQVGDTLDLALDYVGLTGSNDGADSSTFTMKVDQVGTAASLLVADSIADFPVGDDAAPKQGTNNWFYGRHNVTANGAYQAGDFIAFNDNDAPGLAAGTDDWNGNWDRNGGTNPPWTFIGSNNGHPNGAANAAAAGEGDSWIIRRWVSEVNGDVVIDSFFAKQNLAGGDGVIGRIFLNGVEVYTQAVGGTDGQGFNATTVLSGVKIGDFIDIVIDDGGNDGNDGSFFNARIYQLNNVPEPATALLGVLAMGALAARRRRVA